MSRTFTYRFEDGHEEEASGFTESAFALMQLQHGKCTYNGWAEFMGVGKPSTIGIIGGAHTKGDGFRTGWNPALGCEIRSPSHFKQVLKEKGLVEVGNEKSKPAAPIKKSYIDEEVIKEAVANGAEISDSAAEALIAGKSLADDSVKVIE